MAEMLIITGLETFYGKIQALRGVDLHINKGEIVTLIGANGAGKSTLLMSICGRVKARSGAIVLEGFDITKAQTHEIIQMGVSQSPEGRRIFPRMTVMENLQLGATTNQMAYFDEDVAKVFDLFPRLNERKNQRGGTLSGGEQQMLAIGRALMSRPKLLLMDEPSLGIAPILVRQIFQAIGRISKEEHVTIFLVEQKSKFTSPPEIRWRFKWGIKVSLNKNQHKLKSMIFYARWTTSLILFLLLIIYQNLLFFSGINSVYR